MHDDDRERLRQREKGYREVSNITAFLKDGEEVTPQTVFTFQSDQICPKHCGPDSGYRELVVQGAQSRGLPQDYVEILNIRKQVNAES
jgi:hypothetical protein